MSALSRNVQYFAHYGHFRWLLTRDLAMDAMSCVPALTAPSSSLQLGGAHSPEPGTGQCFPET